MQNNNYILTDTYVYDFEDALMADEPEQETDFVNENEDVENAIERLQSKTNELYGAEIDVTGDDERDCAVSELVASLVSLDRPDSKICVYYDRVVHFYSTHL